MQQVDRAELILSDTVRAAKVVRLRLLGGVFFLARFPEIPEYAVDFLLGENAVRSQTVGFLCPFLFIGANGGRL